jgi:hypothetical protein
MSTAVLQDRSSTWRIRVVPFECPFCSTLVHANLVETSDRTGRRVRLTCGNFDCARVIIEIECLKINDDE